jgi:hypothetical protein
MDLILKYFQDRRSLIRIYTQPGRMGEIWWRSEKFPWKKSKAQKDVYAGKYCYLYGQNTYTNRDNTAELST